jgi:hypothetical protein
MIETKTKISDSPVKIDLSKPFTAEDVRAMIRSVRDDRTWRLVITYAGLAYLCDCDEVRHRQPPKIREYPLGVQYGDPRLAADRKLRIERDQKLLDERSDLVFVAFESFCHGNGYVGSKAAQDDRWVENVYQDLCQKWPRAAGPSNAVLGPLPDGL